MDERRIIIKLLYNKSTDPYFNLALEEYALTNLQEELLMLWQNDNTIVVGSNQNTLAEINSDYVAEKQINVVRRTTGGGAVYHDLGNVNFTMISPNQEGDFDNYAKFTKPVVEFLGTLGIKAELKGRNDLLIDGKKFSGNAQTIKNGWIMHHGTLLFDTDFTILTNALSPKKGKVESKGIPSINSRVTNISDYLEKKISTEEFIQLFYKFLMEHMKMHSYVLAEADVLAVEKLREVKYSNWDWNYGKSPNYNFSNDKKFDSGFVEMRLQVEQGTIKEAKIYGDFFSRKSISELEEMLKDCVHNQEALEVRLKEVFVSEYISGVSNEEFLELFR